jgi:hypothetical protein
MPSVISVAASMVGWSLGCGAKVCALSARLNVNEPQINVGFGLLRGNRARFRLQSKNVSLSAL